MSELCYVFCRMVRPRVVVTRGYEKFDRLPIQERQALCQATHHNFDARVIANGNRSFHPERGLALHGLAESSIPQTVTARRWERFIGTYEFYVPQMVQEFYAALIPEVFKFCGVVNLRGRRIVVDEDAINEFFGLEFDEPWPHIRGTIGHDYFKDLRSEVAASLRFDGNGAWDKCQNILYYKHLHPDLQVWTLFLKDHLIPSTHRTTIAPDLAYVLYSIKHNFDLNLGRIIREQIRDTASSSGILTFPCLITHFCRQAEVPIPHAPMNPPRPFGRSNLQDARIALGLIQRPAPGPRQPPRPARRGPDRDVIPPISSHDDAEPSTMIPPASNETLPPWAREMLALQQRAVESMELIAEAAAARLRAEAELRDRVAVLERDRRPTGAISTRRGRAGPSRPPPDI